jgi:hypothetical protein
MCKVQIVVNEHGIVRDVSAWVPATIHDRSLIQQSGVVAMIPKDCIAVGIPATKASKTICPNTAPSHLSIGQSGTP